MPGPRASGLPRRCCRRAGPRWYPRLPSMTACQFLRNSYAAGIRITPCSSTNLKIPCGGSYWATLAEHASAGSRGGRKMLGRPADACPYPKPFTADFNDCPTYQTRHAIVVDSNDRPLHTIWSCRHMETKQVPGEPG